RRSGLPRRVPAVHIVAGPHSTAPEIPMTGRLPLIAGLWLCLSVLPHAASAQGGSAGLDSDGDGFVSRPEAQVGFDEQFYRLDANRDGRISREEFLAPRGNEAGDRP